MNPKLIFTSGPLKTATFELKGGEVSIGRDPSNHLSINDLSVSRRHSVIMREGARFKITDLESHNGTFVNDIPVREQFLNHGDRIKLGNSFILFLLHDVEVPPDFIIERPGEEIMVTKSVIRFRTEDIVGQMARELNVLMKVSQTINSSRSLAELQQQLLEIILDVIPAQHGAILLVEEGPEQPPKFYDSGESYMYPGPFQVSSATVRQSLGEGVAVICSDPTDEPTPGETMASDSRALSVLCVPLTLGGRRLGVIYLDAGGPPDTFCEGHIKLLTAISNVASVAVENIRRVEFLESENRRLRDDSHVEHQMIGESAAMRKVYEVVKRVSRADSTVMLRGESGTGKELAARAIHLNSPRAEKPFVAVNCATLTETLLESELFGHEKGAFTGAVAQRKGKLEAASGGTVFLDEVGELSSSVQAKILRVLQEREFERVGGNRPIKVDLRIITATNRDLEGAVKAGDFRQDLYYRLNVVSLQMPPLRERREDINLLTNYFAVKYSEKCKRPIDGISAEARSYLVGYDWPGNVRELENVIERAIVLGSTPHIVPEDLPETLLEKEAPPGIAPVKYYESIKEYKKQLVVRAVAQAGGNYKEAAELLGIHPNNLHRLIRNLGLR